MTSSHPIESLCVCVITALPTHCLEPCCKITKMVIKYCHNAIGSASSYLRTNGPYSNRLILSPNRLSFPPSSYSYSFSVRTRATFSVTCQLQTITTINGLPLPGPPVAGGSSGVGEGKLQQVQQQLFAFQELVSIISGGGGEEERMRSECMQRGWRELIMEFGINGRLSIFLNCLA